MKADVFIPTTNVAALNLCLSNLEKQTFRKFKIILVGCKTSPDLQSLIGRFGNLNINYFKQRKPGLVAAANEALGKAKNDLFIRIDDDTITTPNWLSNIVTTFSSNLKIGAVTGPTILTKEGLDGRDSIKYLKKFKKTYNPFWKLLSLIYTKYVYENKMYKVSIFFKSGAFSIGANFGRCLKLKKTQEVQNLEACNFACRRSLLLKIGGFDKAFSSGLGEYHEADVAFKIRKLGYKLIFNPKIKVWHRVELSQKRSRPDARGRIENFIIFYFRHIGIKNIDSFFRFSTNLLFQNMYYFYKFLSTGNISQLGCFPGTITGLIKAVKK